MQIFRFSTARVKTHQISHVIFQTKSGFFFKVWITLQCHEITLLHFFSWNVIDKSSTSKCIFSDLPLQALKSAKFYMSFLKPRASFSSNFASFSSVMKDNSSVLFHLKLYMLLTKGTHQVQIVRLCNCSCEN